MRRFNLELSVGLFFIIGILCLAYLSIRLGKMEVIGSRGTAIYADFSNIGGLKNGAVVEIAGVEVGRVKDINLDLDNYEARVQLLIQPKVQIQEDAIASIKTRGLVGEKYIEISPGGSEKIVRPGGKIRDTQPPFDLEKAISKLVFGKV
jgi:phospholipid/cholesterol/gamma-HCH transport system substrate-binding protein